MSFTGLTLRPFDIPKLRGFFSERFPNDTLFHNHVPNAAESFQYPKVQYRVISGMPALLGIGEGIDLIKKVLLEVDHIRIGENVHTCNELNYSLQIEDFGQSNNFYDYKITSPWMGLNQENYREFCRLDGLQKKTRLKSILRKNLLTLSKGFLYTIPDFDSIELDAWFKPVERNFHNIPMQCFWVEFTTNFAIPDYLALGKQVARGFGVVERLKEER